MSKKRPSEEFIDRTTASGPEGVTITPPATPGPTRKFYVSGAPKTREAAEEMGRKLFDQIAQERAKDARASE